MKLQNKLNIEKSNRSVQNKGLHHVTNTITYQYYNLCIAFILLLYFSTIKNHYFLSVYVFLYVCVHMYVFINNC